jgi:hypothetical protein
MTDLAIRHCALMIRRPAATTVPWLDGDDHRAIARRVQAIVLPMLEELLAPGLRDRPGAQGLPLEIDLTLAARDLVGAAPLARPSLRARLADAVETGLAAAELGAPHVSATLAVQERGIPPLQQEVPKLMPSQPAMHTLRFLQRLFAAGAGAAAASLLSVPTLVELLQRVLDALPPSSSAPPEIGAIDDRAVLSAHASGWRDAHRAALVAALTSLATALAVPRHPEAEAPGPTDLKAVRAEAERTLAEAASEPARAEAGRKSTPERPADRLRPVEGDTAKRREADRSRSESPRRRSIDDASTGGVTDLALGRQALNSALPFLALAVLARHGIADAMALDMPDLASCKTLAAAVALKALPSGTAVNSAGELQSTAQVVGLGTAPNGAAFIAAAARLSDGGALCRAGAAAALLGSLDTRGTLPLVVHRDQLVLFDPGGLYPIACGAVPAVVPLLHATGRTFFLTDADPEIWQALDAAALPVVAEGPALPAERAAPVAGPAGWHGRATLATRLSRGLLARLPRDAALAARATAVWQALDDGAPLVRRPTGQDRTRALSDLAALLAGFALADIGWNLFRHDPASWAEPDPLLVRGRFADLSGWLEVGSRRITVILPLGRRALDLRDAGLLDTVGGLPWFPGRDLAFRGG